MAKYDSLALVLDLMAIKVWLSQAMELNYAVLIIHYDPVNPKPGTRKISKQIRCERTRLVMKFN